MGGVCRYAEGTVVEHAGNMIFCSILLEFLSTFIRTEFIGAYKDFYKRTKNSTLKTRGKRTSKRSH